MGFLTLKEHPLGTVPRSLYFPGLTQYSIPKLSMPLNQSGPLRRIIIAAKFNTSVDIGWPEIQIIRRASSVTNGSDTYDIAFSTVTAPRHTGYLNLYEYDLVVTDFDIQV